AGAGELLAHLQASQAIPPLTDEPTPISSQTLLAAVGELERHFDGQAGGWGDAPKFPQAMTISFLLSEFVRSGVSPCLPMAEFTLQKMAEGGMYDQIGGGFHRYSVDAQWLVPHFEKMLYDNALLLRAYTQAWQVSGKPAYLKTACEIVDSVLREMTSERGAFYSSQDADSEGHEGKFFVWTPAEVRAVLGDLAELFCAAYHITEHGNFEGRSIPNRLHTPTTLAQTFHLTEPDLEERLATAKARLYQARRERIAPACDEKVLTAWNGWFLCALAELATATQHPDYTTAAVRNAEFLAHTLLTADGLVYRTWRAGSSARLNGYLEDYAALASAFLAVYQLTFDENWYLRAKQVFLQLLERFSMPDGLGFYDTAHTHEPLVVRPRDLQDNATPSGNAQAALLLLKFAAYEGNSAYRVRAEAMLATLQAALARYPNGFAYWLATQCVALAGLDEIAIVGDFADPQVQGMLARVRTGFRPFQVVAYHANPSASVIPLLQGKVAIDGRATAYVCRNFACELPLVESLDGL
ncbi:MAG TPA: hypothetical protein PK299_15040, partial [Anaerolineales bacterium]|nr:hypothetical protein [Anaerolineales bacterium]